MGRSAATDYSEVVKKKILQQDLCCSVMFNMKIRFRDFTVGINID